MILFFLLRMTSPTTISHIGRTGTPPGTAPTTTKRSTAATLTDNARKEVDELTVLLKDNLGKVVQHGKRADSIVKNMLLHSRDDSGQCRAPDINALVDESLNLAYHGARAERQGFNIGVERDFDPTVGSTEVYPQEITHGFYAANKPAAEVSNGFLPRLETVTRNLGDKVEIRIRDNGTGIPLDITEKIFNPFFDAIERTMRQREDVVQRQIDFVERNATLDHACAKLEEVLACHSVHAPRGRS
jgi:K+-sensing histidine kinase KdpD